MTTPLAGVYDSAAADWAAGPAAVYAVLADALLQRLPGDLTGVRCLDVGAGTGVASRPLAARGASVAAVDLSLPMLRWEAPTRPPAVVADVEALPVADARSDLVVAAFCLNHLPDPRAALDEVTRVLRPGGRLLASTWSAAPDPLKQAAEQVLRLCGWTPPEWYVALHAGQAAASDPGWMTAAVAAAGLRGAAQVEEVALNLPPEQLALWRLRMPHTAEWLATLTVSEVAQVQRELVAKVASRPWSTRMVVVDARRPGVD